MVSCAGWVEPLNLECILINNLAGNVDIFAAIFILFIAAMGAYFRMLNVTIFIMFALAGILFMQIFTGVWLLILIVGAAFAAWAFNRALKG